MGYAALFEKLPAPARYFPLEKGVYEVAPGLRTLGMPFGNGDADSRVFQLDREFESYRANKLACRSERLGKYHCVRDLSPEVSAAAAWFLVEKYCGEYPDFFRYSPIERKLVCRLTGEELTFDSEMRLIGIDSPDFVSPPYVSALDALACQVQEDIAVMSGDSGGRNWLSALHLCSPSHWAAESKIGKDFVEIHLPVAGIEKVNKAAASLFEAMVRKGPYVRFVWGFGTDSRLNHHPEPPPGFAADDWRGRVFKRVEGRSPFVLRVERQTTNGLPEVNASVFTIRVSFIDGEEIRSNVRERELMKSSLLSMNEEQLGYKGLRDSVPEIISWFDEKSGAVQ